jgi:hypothetical protein
LIESSSTEGKKKEITIPKVRRLLNRLASILSAHSVYPVLGKRNTIRRDPSW